MTDADKNEGGALPSRHSESKKRKGKKEREHRAQLQALRDAVGQVAMMLCEAAGERDFFISDASPSKRRLDTKALKEFTSVLKEVCSVVAELNGEGESGGEGIRIEFSDEALGYSY